MKIYYIFKTHYSNIKSHLKLQINTKNPFIIHSLYSIKIINRYKVLNKNKNYFVTLNRKKNCMILLKDL